MNEPYLIDMTLQTTLLPVSLGLLYEGYMFVFKIGLDESSTL